MEFNIKELIESQDGIKSFEIDSTAEGYEGTHLEMDAEVFVKKSVRP